MDKGLSTEVVNQVYEEHKLALARYFTAKEEYAVAEVQLLRAQSPLYNDGTIKGKNAEEREASSRAVLGWQHSTVDDAKEKVRKAELVYESTKIDVARVETLSRIYLADSISRSILR